MKFTAAAALAFATGAIAAGNDTVVSYTTSVVTSTTIWCPESTTLTYGTKTITVTQPTTLTITDCPVTVKVPVTTKTIVNCHACNATATTPPVKPPVGTGGVVPTKPPPVQAGAGKVAVGGAAIAGVLGFAALL